MRLWDKCESSIEMLQNDVRGLSDIQAKTDHKIATVVTGLKEVTEGLAEVRSHMLGQFWASMQGICEVPEDCRSRPLGRHVIRRRLTVRSRICVGLCRDWIY